MKRVTIVVVALLLSGFLTIMAGAYSFPLSLSGLGLGTSSLGYPSSYTQGMPAFTSQLSSSPGLSAFGMGSPLQNMAFFQPSRAKSSLTSGIPASDTNDIMSILSQLPSPQQAQQYYGATPTPSPTPTPGEQFRSVSGTIPSGYILLIEVGKTTTLIDPTSSAFTVPNVTMNFQYNDKQKTLKLKRKSGVDVNNSQIIFGYTEDNDKTGKYLFDYALGSCPWYDVPILFTGSDGRVAIQLNGQEKDLTPGQQAQIMYDEGDTRTSITVTNDGLVPLSNVQVLDTL